MPELTTIEETTEETLALDMSALNPADVKLAVIYVNKLLVSGSGWPIRLINDANFCVPIVAIRPPAPPAAEDGSRPGEDPRPPCVTRSLMITPTLRVGTIDELVAAYRQDLEGAFAAGNATLADRLAILKTASTFDDAPEGTAADYGTAFAGATS